MPIANLSGGNQAGVTAAQITEEQFQKRLGELATKWQQATDTDLEIRHQTGALLNERYGKPDKRLKRGQEILRVVAGQLQVAQSELSRMRRLAFHFESVEDLKKKHSEVTNWTAVKGLLPKLKPQATPKGLVKNGAPTSKPKVSNARKLRKITSLLDALPTELGEIKKDILTDEERANLQAKFKLVADRVSDCLKASVSQDKLHATKVLR
jgi:hypothetical protein